VGEEAVVTTLTMVTRDGVELGFPWWLQVTHFLNFLFIGLLIRSGWEILASHPRLYWRNDCGPGTEWLKFTKDKVPHEIGAFTARDDQRTLHPLISLRDGPRSASAGPGTASSRPCGSSTGSSTSRCSSRPDSGAASSRRPGTSSPRPGSH